MFTFLKLDKDLFDQYLENSDLIMCKRNYIPSYAELFGLIDSQNEMQAACVIVKDEPNKLIIKLFEISSRFYRNGLGTKFFNQIKSWYYDTYTHHNMVFELEALDDDAESFWKYLGFEEFENEDGDIQFRCYL